MEIPPFPKSLGDPFVLATRMARTAMAHNIHNTHADRERHKIALEREKTVNDALPTHPGFAQTLRASNQVNHIRLARPRPVTSAPAVSAPISPPPTAPTKWIDVITAEQSVLFHGQS